MDSFVCVSVFNYGAIELALNHLESLRRQHITNYIAYVTDPESRDAVLAHGFGPVVLLDYDTTTSNELSFLRYKVIRDLLLQGKNVWYMDVDTVVLTPLQSVYDTLRQDSIDLACQDDLTMLCSGCMLYFSNPATIALTGYAYDCRRLSSNDQFVLDAALKGRHSSVRVHTLDPMQFPNGLLHFYDPHQTYDVLKIQSLQTQYQAYTGNVFFVHANWMIGIPEKISALKSKNLWFL